MKPKQKVCLRSALLAVFLIVNAALFAAPYKILVMLSYDPAFPTSPDIAAGLADEFPPLKYDVFIHNMNTKRIPGPERTELFRQEIAQEISASGKPDIVLTCDDNTLRFAVSNRDALFPGVSIVFAGVNDYRYVWKLLGTPGITGVMENTSSAETIGLMRILFPKTGSIDVIVDGTETGQAELEKIKNLGFPLMIRVLNISNMSEQTFREMLKKRPASQPLLLLSAFSGYKGKMYSFWDSLELIRKSTPSPVFHLWKHGVGHGLIGGVVESHYEQISVAAALVRRILAGEKAESIPVVEQSPNVPMFDWNELHRFGISTAKLPLGSKVLNLPLSLRELHPTFFWILVVCGIVVVGLICMLVIVIRYRSKAAVQLARNVAFLDNLINSIDTPIYLKDTGGRYTMINHSFAALSGRKPEYILGKKSGDLLSAEASAQLDKVDQDVLKDGKHHQAEITVGPGTAPRTYIVTKVPLEDMNGKPLILCSMQDVTADRRLTEQLKTENTRLDAIVAERTEQLEKANEELMRMAETDQLTKLPNRRKLDAFISDEIGMAKRYGHVFALIMFDLDHFKQVNDELGHQTGDEVLVAVANILERNRRATDLAGRWGGEEFLIVCKGCAESGAVELAEKLRDKIETAGILPARAVTASFGVCEWQEGDSMDTMLPRADERLYAAKRAGRNCVVDANGAHRGSGGSSKSVSPS